ncbi:glyoxal oxidase N-terminus-domain-containing protein [Gilbertella persicaria]|uniref:glyoxal oxidase N-terminus-domain-containing protein n=1 Tax=Gilbertella persicaria TaxID=101096 RepID=UPI002220911D|nr:glyoxal oxidase N-terminus-domain-containing protein [Gilbertella persicaria]KAI8087798.1 glyoxal oxidase N-terminus-domain-containing protein [Gilbertella persicaria]
MKIATSIALVWATLSTVLSQSPFYYQHSQESYSEYAVSGKMEQIGRTGVAAMHAVLLNEKSILIIDKAEENEAKLDSGVSAFSTLYDIETNTYRTLLLETNTFCSAGGFLANGTFISTGGAESRSQWKAARGHQSIRHFRPCSDESCAWVEYPTGKMYSNRWYPTVEQLPEGDLIIIGGSIAGTKYNTKEKNVPSYEFWPPRTEEPVPLDLLLHTLPYNLYPFVFLLPDGNLFIFASTKSIIYDYKQHKVVRELPRMPGVPRSYPLTGGAVMLPLSPENGYNVEILICGGSHSPKNTSPADDTCGRINLGDKDPQWEMDTFVHKRVMPDGVILADGSLIWVNGCQRGYAGYKDANHDPTFDPLIYHYQKPLGDRWTQGLANTDIARMYHSVALALPDGRVWIAGSNSVDPPDIHAKYPTEYRVEYYSPPYLFRSNRPKISHIPRAVEYNQTFEVLFHLEAPNIDPKKLKVAIMRPGFSTHSMHMSQRYVYLVHQINHDHKSINITAPPHANIFPPGQGFLVVVYDGVPSKGVEFFVEHNKQDLKI